MKRIVITAGDARVGKSTTSRLLLDMYLAEGVNVRAVYSGHRNKLDAYGKYLKIDKFNLARGDYDEFIGSLELIDDIEVVLMDMPGQILPEFVKFARMTYLLEGLHAIGYRVTFLHPISYRQDCVGYLHDLTAEFQNKADYIVVKNECFGKGFAYYDGREIETTIKQLNGITMDLPVLNKSVYSKLDEVGCTYTDAAARMAGELAGKIPVIERSFVFTWLNKFRYTIESNSELLKYFGLVVSS
jgi:hypothetical protein